ncbi:hypothetical protein [Haloprofundus salinisoli]|uniref:hypothetical protein n=1 Tax=Haloprofundus salinisoli TaxID=2876193 RepID=UPI001CCF18A3|nr:hypothetical protein [Haloprofundus salinisoli]
MAEKDEEETKRELRIDGDAYNQLTKPDPHWATLFRAKDVRGQRWSSDFLKLDKESYFKMLGEIHRGEKNGPKWEHSELKTYRLRVYLVENIGERLNLTSLQIDRAKARATNVDAEKFGKKLELVAFCSCAYVVHRDENTPYAAERKYHPNCAESDEIFNQVALEFGLRQHDIDRVCRQFDQMFSERLPPKGFDERKPNWTPTTTR